MIYKNRQFSSISPTNEKGNLIPKENKATQRYGLSGFKA
jgi:hypothetical protein